MRAKPHTRTRSLPVGAAGEAPAAVAGGAASGSPSPAGMPVIRYSAARSGLLKAARMARSTWSRGKPISTRLPTAALYEAPVARVEASKAPATGAAAAAGAGAAAEAEAAGTGAGAGVVVVVVVGTAGVGAGTAGGAEVLAVGLGCRGRTRRP
jgi:hypothetical protein